MSDFRLHVKAYFKSDKSIPNTPIKIGKYLIDSMNEIYSIKFEDELKENRSNPLMETKLILSVISFNFRTKISLLEFETNGLKSPLEKNMLIEYYHNLPNISSVEFNSFLENLNNIDYKVSKQYIRACEVYREAVNNLGTNNTLSQFLFCISIECLSNITMEGNGSCDKFVNFIVEYYPYTSDNISEEEMKDFLKEIYYRHRSGFTHGGKIIPEAVKMADDMGRIYVKNTIDGKVVRTPGLKWFENVVYSSLLNFINRQENSEKKDNIKDLSMEFGIVNLEITKPIMPGHVVTLKDVDID